MVNQEHVAILQQGVDAWNQWRREDPHVITPDFRGANLAYAHLAYAHLRGADLRDADLEGANLFGAHLKGAHLRNANLRNADLRNANLVRADLRNADLRGTNLVRADLGDAFFKETVLDSRTALNDIASSVTPEQLAGMVFADEMRFTESEKQTNDGTNEAETPFLRITIDGSERWTPYDVAALLVALQTSYNNTHFLSTTELDDLDEIKRRLDKRHTYVAYKDDIQVKSIRFGSILIDLGPIIADNYEILRALSIGLGALFAISKFVEKIAIANEKFENSRIAAEKWERQKQREDSLLPMDPSAPQFDLMVQNITEDLKNDEKFKRDIACIQVNSPVVEENKADLILQAHQIFMNVLANLMHKGHKDVKTEMIDPANDNDP